MTEVRVPTEHADRAHTSTLRAMRCLEIKRQMASDDIASVTELLDAAARADGRRPLSDHLYLDLVNGGLDGFAGFLAIATALL